ncbi:hypothetical protein P700755_000944 [Psychroflexus torquis ATCC 700755]|uniref:Uncharacterized protein n=1 Tax=Psychroflexus torquis (strain ATCC 700755 / CIP 106069 / ACAM 623) TaxID=313595 RepID=K4IR07_PSYTT|nr:hypothetical protein P700755_000944 [Psychroflexus torquis ATCC 700755]
MIFLELSQDAKESMAQLNVMLTFPLHRNKRVRLIKAIKNKTL